MQEPESNSAEPAPRGWPALVRWTGPDIFVILLLSQIWVPLAYDLLPPSGFYRWYHGPELVEAARPAQPDPTVPPPKPDPLAQQRLLLWARALAFFFQIGGTLVVLHSMSQTRPAEVGLTTHRLGWNALAGALAA